MFFSSAVPCVAQLNSQRVPLPLSVPARVELGRLLAAAHRRDACPAVADLLGCGYGELLRRAAVFIRTGGHLPEWKLSGEEAEGRTWIQVHPSVRRELEAALDERADIQGPSGLILRTAALVRGGSPLPR